MNPLNNLQKTSIVKRIDFIEIELKDLDAYKKLDFETYSRDRKVRRDVERILENVANASIDIGKIFLAGEDIDLPDTYKEIFIKLEQAGVISKDLSISLSDLARLRNILAHQYLDLKWVMVKDFIDHGKENVQTFLTILKTK